jgi:putative flippase GtrA
VKEVGAFGVVGAAGLLLDLGLFQLLYTEIGLGAVSSRFTSATVAMTFAYFAHRHWSFADRGGSGLGREYALFVVVTVLSMAISLGMLALVRHGLDQHGSLVLQVTNIVSTAASTLVRFLLYRRWVFVESVPAEEARPGRPVVRVGQFTPPPVAGERAAAA